MSLPRPSQDMTDPEQRARALVRTRDPGYCRQLIRAASLDDCRRALEIEQAHRRPRKGVLAALERRLAGDEAPKLGRPTLPDGVGAESQIHLRVQRARKAAYVRAANRAGITLAAWIIALADAAAVE